jgi:diacylglycerol kinase (ATP)
MFRNLDLQQMEPIVPIPEPVHEDANDVIIACNPIAGTGKKQKDLEELEIKIRAQGFNVQKITDLEVLTTTSKELTEKNKLRAVIAAGGDGTVQEVINRVPQEVPLVVFPMGTENLLAKLTCQDGGIQTVVDTIKYGHYFKLDASIVNDRLFCLMLSAGFDSAVVEYLANNREGNIHHLSYLKPILHSLRNYQYPDIQVEIWEGQDSDDSAEDFDREPDHTVISKWCFVFNLPIYASGLQFVPYANAFDGLLDVVLLFKGSLLSSVKYLIKSYTNRIGDLEDCERFQAKRIRIRCESPLPYQIDGDLGGHLPIDIRVVPERIRILVPENWKQKLEEKKLLVKA